MSPDFKPDSQPDVVFLLVDDLDENLIALEALLRRPRLELVQARSAREALEILLTRDVALAIVDVQMPEMDGFELAELMRGSARTRNVPIIFVTAAGPDAKRVFQGYEAGAVDFLFKPIDGHILRSKADAFFRLEVQQIEQRRLTRELEQTLRINETFVAAVGHDLRSPLSAMLLGASLLASKLEDPSMQRVASRIARSGKRMSRMIDDLFDLARARRGGGIPIEVKPAKLGDVARASVVEVAAATPERDVRIEERGDLDGAWDENRIAQVVSNLVGNALRHGAAAAPVFVRVGGDGDVVTIRVENSGMIADDVRSTLFDPFRAGRLESKHRARAEGLGLGLFIVDQIVRAHGGEILVSSADGKTTFVVTLPRFARTSAPPPASTPVASTPV